MNNTDIRDWPSAAPGRWNDSPATSGWAADVPEWEASLLLPQRVAAVEHPAGPAPGAVPAPTNRLLSLWQLLHSSARRPLTRPRVLQFH